MFNFFLVLYTCDMSLVHSLDLLGLLMGAMLVKTEQPVSPRTGARRWPSGRARQPRYTTPEAMETRGLVSSSSDSPQSHPCRSPAGS